MNEIPWYLSLFDAELLKQRIEELTKKAEKYGITLEEYLYYAKIELSRETTF